MRMGRAENDVHDVGMVLDNVGQGFNHHLDALARRQQAEGQQYGAPLESKLVLVKRGINERHVRDAVGYEGDFFRGHAVYGFKYIESLMAHDHQSVAALDEAFHDGGLSGRRVHQHGMQGGVDRHA